MTPIDVRIRPSADVMIRQIEGESVLLDLKTEQYLGFDAVATRMWEVLTASESIKAGLDLLAGEYDVSHEVLREHVDEFVQELLDLGLVEPSGTLQDPNSLTA